MRRCREESQGARSVEAEDIAVDEGMRGVIEEGTRWFLEGVGRRRKIEEVERRKR